MTPKHHNFSALLIASILAISILSVDAAKLVHSIHHHSTKNCTQTGPAHFHEKPLDCKFCGIHFSPVIDAKSVSFQNFETTVETEILTFYQSFIRFDLSYSFRLRGPPTIA
ncbi:MAG: hypothetical protein KKC03_10545 [Bacteroidetes bacterium]|nr:hypothetical protein [Bacteroidota bacterium]